MDKFSPVVNLIGEESLEKENAPKTIEFIGGSGICSSQNYYNLSRVKISSNLNKEELYELGRKGPYYRYVEFPVEIELLVK